MGVGGERAYLRRAEGTGWEDSGPKEKGSLKKKNGGAAPCCNRQGLEGCQGALGNRVIGWVGGARSRPGCAAVWVPAANWGAAPPDRGRGVRRGRTDPAPAGKGASLAPPVPVPVRPAPLPDTH